MSKPSAFFTLLLLPGFPNEFRGITYHNSPVRGHFIWEFEVIMRDLDGTLSGNNIPNRWEYDLLADK